MYLAIILLGCDYPPITHAGKNIIPRTPMDGSSRQNARNQRNDDKNLFHRLTKTISKPKTLRKVTT